MNEAKKLRRIFPCPDYDIVGTQNYLQDMAAQGWHLQNDGIFAGVATFEKGQAAHVRYRLDPAPRKTGFVFGDSEPDTAARALAEEMGWEFVDYRGEYFIFRCSDPAVPELHTDKDVQALSIEKVRSREKANVFNAIFWTLIYPNLILRGLLLNSIVFLTTPLFLSMVVHVVYILGSRIKQARYLKQVKAALLQGEELPTLYQTGRQAKRAQVVRTVMNVTLAAWIVTALAMALKDDSQTLSTYKGDIPFATMQTFAGDGTFVQDNFLTHFYDKVQTHSDLLADVIEVHQNGDMQIDGSTVYGTYIATYFDAAHPIIARGLVHEMHRKDKFECWSGALGDRENTYEEFDLSVQGVDYCIAYRDEIRNPVVILVKGDHAIRAAFWQSGENQIPLHSWAQILADSL